MTNDNNFAETLQEYNVFKARVEDAYRNDDSMLALFLEFRALKDEVPNE